MSKTKDVQFCPKCGSLDISLSKLSNLGDPIKIQGLMGWNVMLVVIVVRIFLSSQKKIMKK